MADVAPIILQQSGRTEVTYRGKKLIYFAGCDYFRLATHPRVLEAVNRGLREYGLNVAASRQTTGDHRIYHLLEEALQQFFGVEKAVFLPTGYLANLAAAEVMANLGGPGFIDEKAHRSLHSAAQAADLSCRIFRHRDPRHFSAVIGRHGGSHPLVLTDGLFGHDGAIAPLPEYLSALPENGFILVDDAHGAGVLGARGRGTPEHYGLRDRRIAQTITLSKAFGVYGGAVLGSRQVAGAVRKSTPFATGTPLPLPLAAAGLAALKLLGPSSDLRDKLAANVSFVKTAVNEFSGKNASSPILCFAPGSPRARLKFRQALLRNKVFPSYIVYPGGPPEGYFRFAISALHTRKQLEALVAAWLDCGRMCSAAA